MQRVSPWASASLFAVAVALGCSAGGNASPIDVGVEGTGGNAGSSASGGAGPAAGGNGGLITGIGGMPTSRLLVHVEKDGVEVQVFLVGCLGSCADVVAVAKNGASPYTFAWEDGSTNPSRRVCPSSLSAKYSVSATDSGVQGGEFPRPPETVRAEVTANTFDCTPVDAGTGVRDAGPAPVCPSGDTVVGDPLTGKTTYFRQGAAVPAGRYRISYVDGCMTYGLNWTIHNIVPPGWLIQGTLTALPGISGTGYVNFEDCVAANRPVAPLEYDHPGGQLGIWNNDYPLTDNRAGLDGRDPTWCLTPL